MKKRSVTILLVICLAVALAAPAFAVPSLSNFQKTRSYQNEFSDVPSDAWYYSGVIGAYERGIMSGKTGGVFDPMGSITIAETIKLAACLHKAYNTGSAYFATSEPWYKTYAEYCAANELPAAAYRNYDAVAVRSDFAVILGGALPEEALTPINKIADGAIPDVAESYSYGPSVYRLYRAGVLTGSTSDGSFLPGRTIKRAEAAAIVTRILDAGLRATLNLSVELTGEQIYALASPAVFYIEIFDSEDTLLKTGSGFFISESGMAITNNHVITGASKAKITTDSGDVLDVAGIYDYNRKKDIALIQINQIDGKGFPYLEFADSDALLTGATVYTLGSPLGLQASYSVGIVSQSLREIEGAEYIQIDAPISSGSSGGALLDSRGRVVGVTSATAVGAQNINLSVPINFTKELSRKSYKPLGQILLNATYYEGFTPAPDFGAYYNVEPYGVVTDFDSTTYSYKLSSFSQSVEDLIDAYSNLLEQNLFEFYGLYDEEEGSGFRMYYNSKHGVFVEFGISSTSGQDCFTIILS